MVEDERTVESEVDNSEATRNGTEDSDDDTPSADGDGTRPSTDYVDSVLDHDAAAASFLDLEADLEESILGTDAGRERVRGLVMAANRLDATAVPDGYPLDPETDQVVALTIDLGDAETTAYLGWPESGDAESPLRWLLTAMDVRLGDLYGHRLLVERTGGFYTVVTPRERPRSSGDWGLGVAGGHALSLALLSMLVTTTGPSVMVFSLWIALTLFVLPYATYEDAWYVRTHSDADHGPLFWATLSALPILNVPTGLAYLLARRRATFFGREPSLLRRGVRRVRSIR